MTAHLYAGREDPGKGRTDGMGKRKEFQRKEQSCYISQGRLVLTEHKGGKARCCYGSLVLDVVCVPFEL